MPTTNISEYIIDHSMLTCLACCYPMLYKYSLVEVPVEKIKTVEVIKHVEVRKITRVEG